MAAMRRFSNATGSSVLSRNNRFPARATACRGATGFVGASLLAIRQQRAKLASELAPTECYPNDFVSIRMLRQHTRSLSENSNWLQIVGWR